MTLISEQIFFLIFLSAAEIFYYHFAIDLPHVQILGCFYRVASAKVKNGGGICTHPYMPSWHNA
jgi:hypothetical protein